ncbi:MAG: TRAP transporter small permease subunit, partial [Chloroflexota bacterium]|nr:TRAP transporter small permease subunit [Chloroflexota bacterium]
WSGKVFSFLILAATVVVVYEVIMRYVFNAPTIWGLELTIYLCGATYILGGAYAQLYDAHIRVDVLYMHWSTRTKAMVNLITLPIFIFGVGLLVWLGADWTISTMLRGETSGSQWSPLIWPMRATMSLGSLLLLLQGLAKAIRDFEVVRRGDQP